MSRLDKAYHPTSVLINVGQVVWPCTYRPTLDKMTITPFFFASADMVKKKTDKPLQNVIHVTYI